jgi:predicted aspartyl protease
MNSDAWLNIILLVGFLILVGAGISRRRQPLGKVALQGAIWVGIIGILWLAASMAMRVHR